MTAWAGWAGAAGRLRAVLGGGWQIEPFGPDGYRYTNQRRQLSVIAARAEHDGAEWVHASIAHSFRMPTWDELVAVKEALVGPDRHAYQVFPPREQWVSVHPNCLHVWALAEGDDGRVLPDFAAEMEYTSI
jgi:hypothetical protein